MKITTLDVEIALFKHFKFNKNICITNLTTLSNVVRFETDFLSLSPSNYATAVEIKVSKADLKNDLKKPHIKDNFSESHILRYFPKIKYFYYCVPDHLEEAALKQIPDESGLIVIYNNKGRIRIKVIKKPKQLTKYKWDESEKINLLRLGNMRVFGLKNNINKLKQND